MIKSGKGRKPVPVTLRDLLNWIRATLLANVCLPRKQVSQRMAMLTACARHLAQSLKGTLESTPIVAIIEQSPARFERHLVKRGKHSAQSIRNNCNLRNALIRYARKAGVSHPYLLVAAEWERISTSLAGRGTIGSIAKFAIAHRIRPCNFSDQDLQAWSREKRAMGRTHQYIAIRKIALGSAVRKAKLARLFPRLNLKRRTLAAFSLRLKDMHPSLRADVSDLLQWTRAAIADGHLRIKDTVLLLYQIERFCGFVINVEGAKDIFSFDQLLRPGRLRAYIRWLKEKRNCSRRAILAKLSGLHTLILFHPRFSGQDLSWWAQVISEIRKDLQSEADERRRQRQIVYEELAAVPERMQKERLSANAGSAKTLAWQVHDELVMLFLVKMLWYPCCVRGCKIRGLEPNIWQGPVPQKDPAFAMPSWALGALKSDPVARFWQFHFRAPETPRGAVARGLLLREVVPLLEEYLESHRPLLVNDTDPGTLFLNRRGTILTGADLSDIVRNRTSEHASRPVSASSIRTSFADYWLEKYPDGYGELASILWMDYVWVRAKYDPGFRDKIHVYREE